MLAAQFSLKQSARISTLRVDMRVALTALLILGLLLPFINLTTLTTEPQDRPRMELLDAEATLAAYAERNQAQNASRLLAEGARVVDPDGNVRVADGFGLGDPESAWRLERPDIRLYDRLGLVHGRSAAPGRHIYVLRGWVRAGDGWRLAIEHATDITEHATAVPPAFAELPGPVPVQPADAVPAAESSPDRVMQALRRSHERYWAKDVAGYERTIGGDLVRAAETGVRPGTELVAFMRDSPHLPRAAPRQLEMWAQVFGNAALGGWLDVGTTAFGAPSRNRFTLALVWRQDRWQIVQIQSTAVAGNSIREQAVHDPAVPGP